MAAGRATATVIVASASRRRSGGTWRRNRWPAPIASFSMLRLAYLSAAFFFRRSRKM